MIGREELEVLADDEEVKELFVNRLEARRTVSSGIADRTSGRIGQRNSDGCATATPIRSATQMASSFPGEDILTYCWVPSEMLDPGRRSAHREEVSSVKTEAARDWRVRWRLFFSELAGTAMLVFGGLSVVIFMFGEGSPMARLLPNEYARTTVTAFLFGCIGSTIAVSRIGKESGAHINPAVTLGFWLMRKLDARAASGYILAQMLGAALGALPLLAWQSMGRSVAFGATIPGKDYSTAIVVMGEAVTTFGLIATLCVCLGFRRLRGYTPFVIPFLYALMVPLEAHISGTSTNPARSFGPALISGRWDGWWIYWVGPILGTVAAIALCNSFAKRIEVAKLYHFENDRRRLFHRMAGAG